MDGFGINIGVIVMVVINCGDVFDCVLLCFGCFDWQIYLELFICIECKVIFEVYIKLFVMFNDIDFDILAV